MQDCIEALCMIFQSTLPRGERPYWMIIQIGDLNFNPRSREGSDGNQYQGNQQLQQFQSTLPRGERRWLSPPFYYFKEISIHAPARGATFFLMQPLQMVILFQSTLPRGERRDAKEYKDIVGHFNPRSREGSDDIQV